MLRPGKYFSRTSRRCTLDARFANVSKTAEGSREMDISEIPAQLKYRKFDFFPEHLEKLIDMNAPPTEGHRTAGGSGVWSPSKQTFAADVAATFWVFLDEGDPARPHHVVLCSLNLRLSPGAFFGDPTPAEYKRGSTVIAKLNGLYQGAFEVDITPALPVDLINWSHSAPKTVNQQHEKTQSTTNSLSVTIGYKSASGTATYTYSEGESFVVSDWNIVEQGIGNRMRWASWQSHPWDARSGGENITRGQVPDLSRNSMQFLGQGVWKTREPLSEIVPFNLSLTHQPQGIHVLPKVATSTNFSVSYHTHFDVDFSAVS